MADFVDNILARIRRTSAPPTKTLGVSGTAVYGGEIQNNERNKRLIGEERYRTFSDLLANASIVGAGARYYLNLVSKAEWRVQPADGPDVDPRQAEILAELVEEMMEDMTTPWFRVVRRAAMYRFYGFSIQEWTAKRRDDGVLGMLDVEPRAQATIDRWDVDRSGTVHGVVQDSPQSGVEIYLPRGKIVYAVDDSLADSPEGLGLFRHLSEPGLRLLEYQRLESYGYEMDLRGVPIIRAPIAEINAAKEQGSISDQEANNAISGLKDFLQNHARRPETGLLFDSETYQTTDESQRPSNVNKWGLEIVNGGAADSAVAIATAIERLNREMARLMNVEHLMLGGDGKGSMALSRDKTDNFALMVDSSLQELTDVFEKDWLGPIWKMNGWDEKLMPDFRTEQIQYRDIEQITESLARLSDAALAPNDPAINEIRRLIGLSDAPEVDEDLLALMLREEEDERNARAPEVSTNDDDANDQSAEDEGEE